MCGIAGFIGKGDRSDVEGMTSALAHRGPDDAGYHVDEATAVHLGHRRLAIRDKGGGKQPMWSTDGRACIIYNGEVYNHEELREELVRRGHDFASSHSDTEVILNGYLEWGEGIAKRLNGMFAFAIYEPGKSRLYLARDRFGEKPLYFASRGGLFAFASELGALARHRDIDPEPSVIALQKLFGYGYIPAPMALYKGTSKLPGGWHMTVDVSSQTAEISPYWRFLLEPERGLTSADDERLAEELRYLLLQATSRRLVSDVPVGIFLSGGIDSSAVLAAAAMKQPASSLNTFTIGFTEKSYDESEFALAVAQHVGSAHDQRTLSLDAAKSLIPSVLSRLDEPTSDASLLPTYLLSAFAREKVTVALSGDGGDELLAGYDPFKALKPAAIYSSLVPLPIHNILRVAVDYMPRSSRNMSFDFKIRRALMGLSQPESAWAPAWMAPVDPSELTRLFDAPVRVEDVFSEAMTLWETGPAKNRVDRLLQFFTTFYLQDDVLAKVDRAAMMNSLETRAVFLDNDIVDFCRKLPHHFKLRNGERKYLLKKALEPLLPASILQRRKKGFGIPLADWMRDVPPQPPLEPVLGIRTEWATAAWRDHRAGRADNRMFLWTWLALQSVLPARQNA